MALWFADNRHEMWDSVYNWLGNLPIQAASQPGSQAVGQPGRCLVAAREPCTPARQLQCSPSIELVKVWVASSWPYFFPNLACISHIRQNQAAFQHISTKNSLIEGIDAISRWAGWVLVHPEFWVLDNPIPTRGADNAHCITACPTRLENLTASLEGIIQIK
jgi:hypothetical protein